MPAYLTVDPGAKGALVWGDRRDKPNVSKMPDLYSEAGLIELAELCRRIKDDYPAVIGVVEKVGGYVGEEQPASTAFTFGANTMAAKMAIVAAGIPLSEIAPGTWQKKLVGLARQKKAGLGKKARDEAKRQHKRNLRDHAQGLFPGLRATLENADALLLYHLKHLGDI